MSETAKVKKEKASAKRNSEARREQNRLASRNYREKRKQKLALLNELLEPSNVATDITDDAQTNPVQGLNGPSELYATQLQEQSLSGAPSSATTAGSQDMSAFGSAGPYMWEDSSQTTIPTTFFQPMPPNTLPLTNLDDAFSLTNQDPWGDNMFGFSIDSQNASKMTYIDSRSIEEVFESSPESGASPETPPSDDGNDETLNNVLSGVENLTLEQKRSLLRRLQQDTQPATPKPHVPWHQAKPPTAGQLRAIEFAKALYKTAHARPTLLPTQYTMETGIFGAIFANCYALGMAGVDEILGEEGCSVFSVTQDEGHHLSQLPLVKSRFRALSPDLRPIDKQLTFGHHPYVDVIPFKSFRENLIRALENKPSMIDEGILCHDILAGGFTCWGSGRNPHGMAAGVPWDSRSWEPSVWFLMKYRHLAGDWDGELWTSARWWHNARGERIQAAKVTEIANSFDGAARR
ncbi:uncharacterized protein FIESC28_06108 [Fusarium coffeatum]|uniref:BZIP domain-containing protein n=1 Tax=Fusarium coffeatum TaxID=231269 RepID=A0A366RPV8_9HYPO|nr:uncharacterized protein FIESC28_06108 [Fusarium coffeatum]RBR18335.1 hypothetical protein FIESC28_06108 [Fusarium coffeatum]